MGVLEERIINNILSRVKGLYRLDHYDLKKVNEHAGGRNIIYICECNKEKEYVIRISLTGDRTEEDYLAETEFVHYLAEGGASVADVIPSVNGKLVEIITDKGKDIFVSLFNYAKGMLISDKGYCYREGAPLSEYFYNTGKTLGKIHNLSKGYSPKHKRMDYFDKYNMDYLNQLISDEYAELKKAIARKLALFQKLPRTEAEYGLVHFDYSDGNYHIDYTNGRIVVFDFDNCMKCWYMFDLANLWTHGVGWCQYEKEAEKRKEFMKEICYANTCRN